MGVPFGKEPRLRERGHHPGSTTRLSQASGLSCKLRFLQGPGKAPQGALRGAARAVGKQGARGCEESLRQPWSSCLCGLTSVWTPTCSCLGVAPNTGQVREGRRPGLVTRMHTSSTHGGPSISLHPARPQQLRSKGQSSRWRPACAHVPAAVPPGQSDPMFPKRRGECSGVQRRLGTLTCFLGPFSRCWDGLGPSPGACTDCRLARLGPAPLPRSALRSATSSSHRRLHTPTGGPGRSPAPAQPPPPTRGEVAAPTRARCPRVMGPPLVEGSLGQQGGRPVQPFRDDRSRQPRTPGSPKRRSLDRPGLAPGGSVGGRRPRHKGRACLHTCGRTERPVGVGAGQRGPGPMNNLL